MASQNIFKINFNWSAQIDDFGRRIWYNTQTGEINWRSDQDTHRCGDGIICCALGHELHTVTTSTEGFACAMCNKCPPALIKMMGCRTCNQYLCEVCYPIIVRNTPLPAIPKMKLSTPKTRRSPKIGLLLEDRRHIIQKHIRQYLAQKNYVKRVVLRQTKIKTVQINLARTLDGETPLLKAVRNNNTDIVKH